MSNISYNPPMNQGAPGAPVRANGGGGASALGFRDPLDARRAMQGGQIPSAAYPDGYLGTIQSRREDKLLKNLQNRLTQRSYQRGVHKGERIDPQDYYWPEEFGPQTGLQYEARGLRWTAKGNVVERLSHMGHTEFASKAERESVYAQYGIETNDAANEIDPVRQERMKRLLPNWR